jgi:glycosyltransferase involved in cell wall biosynthesis
MSTEQTIALSVVLCAHNEAKVIERQLRALASQECSEPWELVVVDDRSTDGTSDVVESYRDRLPSLTVVRLDSGLGLATARNLGIRRSRGAKIVTCDADDEVQPGWLAAMSRALDTHEIVGARLDPTLINPPWLVKARGIPHTQELPTFLGIPWSGGGALGLRRAVFDTVGGFDEHMNGGEDRDFGVRAALAGFRASFAADAAISYKFRPDARSAYRQARSYGMVEALLMIRHGSPSARRIWWRDNLMELLRLPPRLASVPLLRDRVDRRIHKIAYARRVGRTVGRVHGAVRYGCPPW